jgi:hypothetical protein
MHPQTYRNPIAMILIPFDHIEIHVKSFVTQMDVCTPRRLSGVRLRWVNVVLGRVIPFYQFASTHLFRRQQEHQYKLSQTPCHVFSPVDQLIHVFFSPLQKLQLVSITISQWNNYLAVIFGMRPYWNTCKRFRYTNGRLQGVDDAQAIEWEGLMTMSSGSCACRPTWTCTHV